MSENVKKRTSSFRKLFPIFFFSNKAREKTSRKDSPNSKSDAGSSFTSNQYYNPQTVIVKSIHDKNKNNHENIYENLATPVRPSIEVETQSPDVSSHHSSSSTLVSESVKNNLVSLQPNVEKITFSQTRTLYSARPQVPRKPIDPNQMDIPSNTNIITNLEYPDVYYHSLEKLTDKISPLEEIDIYRASRTRTSPAPVGAEIKKVSTKFLISPKKEAEVRTIQPNRARSLSLDKNNDRTRELNVNEKYFVRSESQKKPYNYSAPTSPMPLNCKIPNMPKTVSPYEHVRKIMIETEEKRNSLNRPSSRNKFTPSPRQPEFRDIKKTPPFIETNKNDNVMSIKKEKTRQKVEAFYWQKLKEQKFKEDDFLFNHSIRSSVKSPVLSNTINSNSTCSSTNSFTVEQRSYSLPRGNEMNIYNLNQSVYSKSPFIRGAPERRTDSFLSTRNSYDDQEIEYRHPEKLFVKNTPMLVVQDIKQIPIYQRGNLNNEYKHFNQQPKRVSFEENTMKVYNETNHNINKKNDYINLKNEDIKTFPKHECHLSEKNNNWEKVIINGPPPPPIRTTSVSICEKSVVNRKENFLVSGMGLPLCSGSESGSEVDELQRILLDNKRKEDDWHGDISRMDGGLSDGEANRGPTRGRSSRRDDPRRHTLAGNHLYINPIPHSAQISSLDLERSTPAQKMNVPEYAMITKYNRDTRKNVSIDPRLNKPSDPRNYHPQNALLFDDDPGIMSEVETASTGFRRGGKQRSSLPVVRTPSKTLERPLGLVFLQYRNETKRALLPNEITSIDTVKALFVRSFPKQLTMQYMDSPMVKIYIHDSSKDMFYELEDDRAHLRDIRDRSILRLFESTDTDIGGGAFPGAVGAGSLTMPAGASSCSGPSSWDQDQSYFSEPEIDSEYHHQHVHKSKNKAPAYYIGGQAPSTLPRGGGGIIRAFSPAAPPPVPIERGKPLKGTGSSTPAKPMRTYTPGSGSERCYPYGVECPRGPEQLYTIPGHGGEGYMSSPERGGARAPYEDPYYTQFLGPSTSRANITPVIDEEASDAVIIDDAYQMYGVNAITPAPRPMPRPPYDARINSQLEEMQRLRVEKMERQLANLTGLVQQALQAPSTTSAPAAPVLQEFNAFAGRPAQDAARFTSNERPPKLGRDKFQKSVSFEKSVSFSDDPPDMNSPKQHSPQHSADTKPTKPAIKSSTLPRTSSQERDRLKPAPPPKPAGLVGQQMNLTAQRNHTISVTPDFFTQLHIVLTHSRDLRLETRNLRRSTLGHAIQMRQLMAETIMKIGEIAASFCDEDPDSQLTREEDGYRQDMLLLENDLYELEATVERLRGQAANRETRVNMADIERIAMVLSKSSKTVADWKLKFPILQETLKVKLASEMEKVVRKEKMLEEEPERLELALRRCKKLTGTLVTLKRLACVQEQRLPITDGRISPGSSQSSTFTAGPSSDEFNSDSNCHLPPVHNKGSSNIGSNRTCPNRGPADLRPENALDALLDELQTFAKPAPPSAKNEGPLHRFHFLSSGSDIDASPPVSARGQHPPKPPVPERHPELLILAARRAPPPPPPRTTSRSPLASPTSPKSPPRPDLDADCPSRHALLEHRHQELLKKQKALQEQYARLQMIQRSGTTVPLQNQPDLKKTGSESNLLTKMNMNLAPAAISGSMTHLAGDTERKNSDPILLEKTTAKTPEMIATTNKVYETDIL